MSDQRSSRRRVVRNRCIGVAAAGGFALATSACIPAGGSVNPITLKVVAQEDFSNQAQPFDFDQDLYVVPRGQTNVVYAFPTGVAPHTLRIRASEALDLAVNTTTRSDEGTVDLVPGTYELYCSIVNPNTGAGHDDLGMTAQLVVV